MEELETIITKRINSFDPSFLSKIINDLNKYNVNLYDEQGEFNFISFTKECSLANKTLYSNDVPDAKTNIRYNYCNFLSIIQTITGLRNFDRFVMYIT